MLTSIKRKQLLLVLFGGGGGGEGKSCKIFCMFSIGYLKENIFIIELPFEEVCFDVICLLLCKFSAILLWLKKKGRKS